VKICIAHFRVGLTDGVSLQIDERARILRQLGHEVFFIADNNSLGADLGIPFLNYKRNITIKNIQEIAFSKKETRSVNNATIGRIAYDIESRLNRFWGQTNFSLIFVHNIFSLPVCLPATIAFHNFLKKHPQIKAIGVNHDFYWDPSRVEKFKTTDKVVKHILNTYFPPTLPNLHHTVLSTWEHDQLKRRRKVESEIITDTFDFDQKPWGKDVTNEAFLDDCEIDNNKLVFLLASRIRARKGIEFGIQFTASFNKVLKQRVPGKSAVLVLPNDFSEAESHYIHLLKERAKQLGVEIKWIQNLVGSEREKKEGLKKYSLWDTYVYADAILYPSIWEGFGNQLLEAFFAKKPVVSIEYPVYKTDFRPAGFKVITMADHITLDKDGLAKIAEKECNEAAIELANLLEDTSKCKAIVEEDFEIGKKKFNTKVQLKKYLTERSERFIRTNGVKSHISPLLLSGSLIASGVPMSQAYGLAESIISYVPEEGIDKKEVFSLFISQLSGEVRERYVTLGMVREFLISPRSSSPLFIFIGGLAGKTTLANYIVQQLNISQSIAFDNEKYHLAKPGESEPYLWKATYESASGYIKTVKALYPSLLSMIARNIFDYGRYKKWCYLWEGIYLCSDIVRCLQEKFDKIYYLSIFNLPEFEDIKAQYVIRWQRELGTEKLQKRKNIIDKYLNNVQAIRSRIQDNLNPIASFVIESSVIEERLSIFYALLCQRLKTIADKEMPGWIEKVVKDPKMVAQYRQFLYEEDIVVKPVTQAATPIL